MPEQVNIDIRIELVFTHTFSDNIFCKVEKIVVLLGYVSSFFLL